MKKLLLLTLMTAALVSCSKSLEEKAQALIGDAVKKSLYIPESYDPVETEIDSAFAPRATQEYMEATIGMCKAYKEISEHDEEANSAKSSMSIWSGPYNSAFGRNEYQESKAKYESAIKKRNAAKNRMEEKINELRNMEEQEPTFIGYSAIHRYRADTNGGQTVFGAVLVFLDKDMSKIVASFDLDSDEFKEMQETLEEMKNEGIFD